MIRISEATSLRAVEIVRELFLEYGALPDVNIARHEIAGLPGEYVPPIGALLVALNAKAGAGCVALRKLDCMTREMKRLYVRPNYRGQGMGKGLVLRIIARAKELAYSRMRLDTRPSMQNSIALYRSLGFREIPSYMTDPVRGALFFELDLSRSAPASG